MSGTTQRWFIQCVRACVCVSLRLTIATFSSSVASVPSLVFQIEFFVVVDDDLFAMDSGFWMFPRVFSFWAIKVHGNRI